MSGSFEFTPTEPVAWEGRYVRIPGETTVFHIRSGGGERWPVIDWKRGREVGHCEMVDQGAVRALVDGVLAGKRTLGGAGGGSFLINEHGVVLVPATDIEIGTQVVAVGKCSGPVVFSNPFEPGTTFDLADHRGLKPGDAWERPYVGLQHNLSGGGELYCKLITEDGTGWLVPEPQDERLIETLRELRGWRPVRFIVTVGGLAVTKVEPNWEPRYVGRIDPACWFGEEE